MSFLSSLFGKSNGRATLVSGLNARALVTDGAQLVDVRTPAEYTSGHVDGATNIPLAVLPVRLHELDQGRAVVVYCRSGGRSASASGILSKAGFTDVYDMGAMSHW